MKQKLQGGIALFSFVTFLFLISSFLFFYQKPSLHSLSSPEIAVGEMVSIEGNNLGDPYSSILMVGGYEVLPRLIKQWTPTTITFTLTENMTSGLIFIKNGFRRSNALFFTNRSQVPDFSLKSGTGAYLISLSTDKVVPTTEVVVKGRFLGSSSLTRNLVMHSRTVLGSQELVLPKDHLISWTDNAIHFIFPRGLGSGQLYLEDEGVRSNALSYGIDEQTARWDVIREATHQLRGSLILERILPTGGESFHFWMPEPTQGITFRKERIRTDSLTPYPLQGWCVYLISAFEGSHITLEHTYEVKSSHIQVILNPDLVKPYAQHSMLVKTYTQPSKLWGDYPHLRELVTSFKIKASLNPHEAAFEIFHAFKGNMRGGEEGIPWESLSVNEKTLSYAQLNSLFVASLREAKIPAREILGILYDEQKHTYRLWQWAEFYLEGIGWLPVDIALSEKNRASYWLKQTENHIVMSPLPALWTPLTLGGSMTSLKDVNDHEVTLLGVPWLYESIQGKGKLRLVSFLFESMNQTKRKTI